MEDDSHQLRDGPGHPIKLPGFAEHAPSALKKLVASDPAVAEYIASIRNLNEEGKDDADVEAGN
jgi:hypothetical protein